MKNARMLAYVAGTGRYGWAMLAGIILLAVLAPPLLLPLLFLPALSVWLAVSRFFSDGSIASPVPAPVLSLAPRAPPRG